MNKIICTTKALLALGMLASMSSCVDDRIEIVEQDTSWEIDDKYITDDIREQLGIDPFSELVYFERASELVLDGMSDLQSTIIEQGNELKLNVRITAPFEQDLNLKIVRVDSLLKQYPGGVGEFISYPEESFSTETQILKAGMSEVEFNLTLKNLNSLKHIPGYILPLRVEIADGVENVKVAKSRGVFFVKLKMKLGRENIADSFDLEIEGTAFNSKEELNFESNVISGLAALNDGVFNGTWYPRDLTSYLIIKLAKKETIKGIKCYVKTGTYNLEKVRVSANLSEADDFIQGVFTVPESINKNLYWIKFKEPIQTDQIKLDLFSGKKGVKDPDFTEIYLVK